MYCKSCILYYVIQEASFDIQIEEQALKNECSFVIFISHIINFFQAMTIVAATLVDLVRNLKAFAGILIVSSHIYM